MSDALIERLEALLAKAVSGTWRAVAEDLRGGRYWSVLAPGIDDYVVDGIHEDNAGEATAALIVEAVNALPTLLSALRSTAKEVEAIEPPENGETDPEWRAIRRTIDYFAGRVPTIGKHRAVNTAHIHSVVARLDAAGDHEAADTIVWLCWHRALDRERERFLLDDARAALTPADPA